MIKIYTFMHSNPKTYEIFDFVDKVSDMTSNPSMMLVFPEISTTLSGWSYPTPPSELRSRFYKFIKQQLEQNHDYAVITFSTLVFDIIRLASKDLNIGDSIEVYDERFNLITSVDNRGRCHNWVPGMFDGEEQTLLRLL